MILEIIKEKAVEMSNHVSDFLSSIKKSITNIIKDSILDNPKNISTLKNNLVNHINSEKFNNKLDDYTLYNNPQIGIIKDLINKWHDQYNNNNLSSLSNKFTEIEKYKNTIEKVGSLRQDFSYIKMVMKRINETGIKPSNQMLDCYKQFSKEAALCDNVTALNTSNNTKIIDNNISDFSNSNLKYSYIEKDLNNILKEYILKTNITDISIFKEKLIKYINSKTFDNKLKNIENNNIKVNEVTEKISNWLKNYQTTDDMSLIRSFYDLKEYKNTINNNLALKRDYEYMKLIVEYMSISKMKPTSTRLDFFKQWALENIKSNIKQ